MIAKQIKKLKGLFARNGRKSFFVSVMATRKMDVMLVLLKKYERSCLRSVVK
jgi:hypothetical protein